MAYEKLPQQLNIRRWVKQTDNNIVGLIPVRELPRLDLAQENGDVEVNLCCHQGEVECYYLQGQMTVTMPLECQRCLQTFMCKMDTIVNLCLYPVDSKFVQHEAYDYIEVDVENVPLWEILEEEILLAKPMIAMHENENCNLQLSNYTAQTGEDEVNSTNPFAILTSLKIDKKS